VGSYNANVDERERASVLLLATRQKKNARWCNRCKRAGAINSSRGRRSRWPNVWENLVKKKHCLSMLKRRDYSLKKFFINVVIHIRCQIVLSHPILTSVKSESSFLLDLSIFLCVWQRSRRFRPVPLFQGFGQNFYNCATTADIVCDARCLSFFEERPR